MVSKSHKLIFISLVPILLLATLPACSGLTNNIQGMSQMPSEVRSAPAVVQQAYQFAAANPQLMKQVPCYCGCGAAGHTSNYSCYVKEVKPSGDVVVDQHALGCSICVDIAPDVMKMTRDSKSPKEIRTVIDQTYSQYGPSNMAPAQ